MVGPLGVRGAEEVKHQRLRKFKLELRKFKLESDKIKKNPGLRSLAKLVLNSFWRKVGQRDNMPQVELVKDPERYFRILTCQCRGLGLV